MVVIVASPGCDRTPSAIEAPKTSSTPSSTDFEARRAARPQASRAGSLAQIERRIDAGDLEAAERLLQTHLLRHPDDPQAFRMGAELYVARGKIDEAVNALEDAARRAPEDGGQFQLDVAMLLAGAGRWQQAIERLETLVREEPDFDEARQALADMLNQRGFRFDANQHVRALCARDRATLSGLRGLLVPLRSHTGLKEKPDLEDREAIEQLGPLNVTRGLFTAGDVNEALQVLNRSRLVAQSHPAAIAMQGLVLMHVQDFEGFERWIAQVDSDCERYPEYWLAMGDWAMRQRDHALAVRLFGEAILREPGELLANDRMTEALAAAGETEASERFRQRGIQIDQLIQYATVYLEDPRSGFPAIGQITQLLGGMGRPLEALGWTRLALEQMGSPADAMRRYQNAKAELRGEEFKKTTRQRLLCDLDLDRFPIDLAKLTDAVSRPSDSSDPDDTRATISPAANRPESKQPTFVNVAGQAGLNFRYRIAEDPPPREFRIFQTTGGGVACFDYDMNGLADLYVAQASADLPHGVGTKPNLLARNLGDGFVDVTLAAEADDRGYSTGVTAGDWNQDGFPDLIVGNVQRNTLLINQGDGSFRVHPGDSTWNTPMYTASVAMADVNGDHLPDIVEVNYLDDPHIYDPIERKADGTPVRLPAPLDFRPAVDRVFLSRGNSELAGRVLSDPDQPLPSTGLGVLITDLDGRPGNEIFIANDHMANHFWEKTLTDSGSPIIWKNTAAARGVAFGARGTPLGCMGIAAADFDENGLTDLHVTNYEKQWSNHYMQNSPGFFEDLVVAYGLADATNGMLGFGTQAIDYDNNSAIDLVIGNGHIDDLTAISDSQFEMPTQLFANRGSYFEPLTVSGDDAYWQSGHLSRAVAMCDWNRDGRLDFVATDLRQPLALLENRTETDYHWIQLKLVGTRSEREAIGAKVTAFFSERSVTKLVQSGDGYMCKNEAIVAFGLGGSESLARLEILWPDGQLEQWRDLPSNRRLLIVEGESRPFELQTP